MNNFETLIRKHTRTVIGVLSGTSVDAVDIVLVKIKGKGKSSEIKVLDFRSYPINIKLKKHILRLSTDNKIKAEDICRLNFVIGNLFAESVNKFISDKNLSAKDIDLIGSHGQTVCHFPANKKLFGFDSRSTLQLGDPSVIANRTGINVIGDFRTADVASGGDGAPLVPYLDYILFASDKKSRAFVNIGGISNVTYLCKSCDQNEVIAFDTGPGNMLIDSLMMKLFKKKYDKNGKTSSAGKVNAGLFKFLKDYDKFYRKKFPKSTGREYYGEKYISDILKNVENTKPADIISTVTKFTAFTIYHNIKRFNPGELLISGGGAKNISLMNFLKEYSGKTEVNPINEKGITTDNKEAVLFALLANEFLNGNRANITSATGSFKNVFLGKFCPA